MHARTSYLYRSHLLLKPISPSHPGLSLALLPTPPSGSPSLMGRTLSALFYTIRVRQSVTPSSCGPRQYPRRPEKLTRALMDGFIQNPTNSGKANKLCAIHCYDPSHAGPNLTTQRWVAGCRGSCNNITAKSEDITLTFTRYFGPLFQSFSLDHSSSHSLISRCGPLFQSHSFTPRKVTRLFNTRYLH